MKNYKLIKGSMTGGFIEGDVLTAKDIEENGVGVERALDLGVIEETGDERSVAREGAGEPVADKAAVRHAVPEATAVQPSTEKPVKRSPLVESAVEAPVLPVEVKAKDADVKAGPGK